MIIEFLVRLLPEPKFLFSGKKKKINDKKEKEKKKYRQASRPEIGMFVKVNCYIRKEKEVWKNVAVSKNEPGGGSWGGKV